MPIVSFFFSFLLYIKNENQLYTKIKKYPYKKEYYILKDHLTNRYNWRSGNGEVCHWRQIQANAMDNPTGGFNQSNHQLSFTSSGSCGGSVSGRCVATCVVASVFCFLELQQGLKSRGSIITSPKRPL